MDYYIDQIRDAFKRLEWDQVYSFIEFVLLETRGEQQKKFITSEINRIFFEEGVQYRIVNGQVIQLMSNEEVKEISTAEEISSHITNAVKLFNKRPEPDYPNSIKESVCAVESVVKLITGDNSATLNSIIGKMCLHPQLESGIKNLYNWASDEGGIRHGLKKGDKLPTEQDARLMLVLCSGLVNYLNAKDTSKLNSKI